MRHPTSFLLLQGLILVMLLLGAAGALSATVVPEIKKDCSTCHVSHGSGSMLALKEPVAKLCISCHPDRKGSAEHKVDVVAPLPVPGLPLTESKVTCVTCHDPHSNNNGMMLRITPEKLCLACHKY